METDGRQERTSGRRVPTRDLGPSGIRVPVLGLGSWGTWDRADEDTVEATLRLALDAGLTYFDVGIYGDHRQEPVPGSTDMVFARVLRRLGIPRDEYTLAAKGWLPSVAPLADADLGGQLDAFLQRQRTDHADVLVLGDLMTATGDYGALLEQVGALLRSGKARTWAVNNWAAREVEELARQAEARGIPVPDAAQLKYGLTRRSVAEGEPFRRLCDERGVRVQASEPFEGGLVFGARRGDDHGGRLIGGDIGGTHERIRQAASRMADAAAGLGATVAQLALAVPLLNESTATVLFGSRTPEQLRDALGVLDLLERCDADSIRAAAEPFWFDREVVSPDASWGTRVDDDPSTYVVQRR